MSFWGNISQQILTFVDNSKTVIVNAAATVNAPVEEATYDPSIRIEVVDIGSLVHTKSLDADLFPSFAVTLDSLSGQSAIGEKRLVGVSRKQIFELSPSGRHSNMMVVQDAHSLDTLAKLRFRKGDEKKAGLLMLELKDGSILKYVLRDPLPCVEVVRRQMSALGISGNVTRAAGNSSKFAEIKTAQELFHRATDIIKQFADFPSIDLVREMMDVMRASTEKFAAAGDTQFEQVQLIVRDFLQRPDVLQVLDAETAARSAEKIPQTSATPTDATADLLNLASYSSDSKQVSSAEHKNENDIEGTPLPAEALQVLVSPSLLLPTQLLIEETTAEHSLQMQRALMYSVDDMDAAVGALSMDAMAAETDVGTEDIVSSGTDQLTEDLQNFLGLLDNELAQLLNQNSSSDALKNYTDSNSGLQYADILRDLDLPDFELDSSFDL